MTPGIATTEMIVSVPAAMAEHLVMPHELTYRVPPEVAGTDLMALGEPLACAVRAVIERWRLKAGDVAYECAGATASLEACSEAVAKTANLVQVGLYGRPLAASMDRVLVKEIDPTVSFVTALTSWEITLRLAAEGPSPGLDRPITARVPLIDWRQGFGMMGDRVGFKTLLVP